MKTKLWLLLSSLTLGLGLLAVRAAQDSSAFLDALRKDEEKQRQKELAEEGEKAVAALRADLAGPWTSVIITYVYDCSCTGQSYHGFRLKREGGAVTVEPWLEAKGMAPVGVPRPITLPEVERLLSETALFYLAAVQSVSPSEKAGTGPKEPAKMKGWFERLLAAGGSLESGDSLGMEVRVVTPAGVKRHSNTWALDCPKDFSKWVAAFGTLP